MQLLSRSKRGESSYGVIIDVGSGSIGVGIVSSNKEYEVPRILFTHREPLRVGKKPTTKERVRAMRQALFAAVLELSHTGLRELYKSHRHVTIGRILVVCSAPWSNTATQIVHFEDKEPFSVTKEWTDELIKNAESKVRKEIRDIEPQQALHILSESGVKVVEKTIVEIKLNGYSVVDPYEKKARELELAHISGLVSSFVIDAIKDIKSADLPLSDVDLHTYALVLYCVFRDMYPHTNDALIIDISGEATEMMIVHDDVLLDTHIVNYGTYTLMREIAKRTRSIPEETKRYLTSFSNTDALQYKKISEAASSYIAFVSDGLEALARLYVLPQNIYVTVDPELESFFSSVLTLLKEKRPEFGIRNIVSIRDETTRNFAAFENNAKPDAFLAISARFFHKLHGCGEIKS